jgi:molecular chaperone GrpE
MSDNSQPNASTNPPPEPAAQAETPAGTAPASGATGEQLAAARQEAAANYERYMRAVADLENFRKRTVREKDELRQFAAASVMEDLLPILDNLSLGLSAARQQTDVKAVADGIGLVLDQLKATLGRHGLKEVNPEGQAFDHNLHECISHLPSNDVPAETVSQVVRRGYTLNGRLVRPASVVVSSGPAKAAEAQG